MNLLLGAGDQTKSRPLLGGLGLGADGSQSARGGAGFGFSSPLEAFARIASNIASGGSIQFYGVNPDTTGGDQDPGIVER